MTVDSRGIKSLQGSRKDATFLLDGMLGSLTRKLRILGYDTLYDPKSNDAQLLLLAKQSNRFLVTSDIALYVIARKAGIHSILTNSRSESGRIYDVLSKIGETKVDLSRPPRCSVCNGTLCVARIDNAGRTVFACSNCGKEYWKGTHWKKLNSLFLEIDTMFHKKRKSRI